MTSLQIRNIKVFWFKLFIKLQIINQFIDLFRSYIRILGIILKNAYFYIETLHNINIKY